MGLYKYQATLEHLSREEKDSIISTVEKFADTGAIRSPGDTFIQFFLDENEDPNVLGIPQSCNLHRIA